MFASKERPNHLRLLFKKEENGYDGMSMKQIVSNDYKVIRLTLIDHQCMITIHNKPHTSLYVSTD